MKKIYATECPCCGKNSLIQRQDDLYQCLACNFKKDFSFLDIGKILLSFFAVIVMALLTKYSYEFTHDQSVNRTSNSQQITSNPN
jgi:hypothetical protein